MLYINFTIVNIRLKLKHTKNMHLFSFEKFINFQNIH